MWDGVRDPRSTLAAAVGCTPGKNDTAELACRMAVHKCSQGVSLNKHPSQLAREGSMNTDIGHPHAWWCTKL